MTLTEVQKATILRTNKYGVVYDVPKATAKAMFTKGLIHSRTSYSGNMHGWQLTADGFAEKRALLRD